MKIPLNWVPGNTPEDKILIFGMILGGVSAYAGCVIGLKMSPPVRIHLTTEQIQMMLKDPSLVANWRTKFLKVVMTIQP